MKVAKALFNVISALIILYITLFAVWFLLTAGCVQYVDEKGLPDAECGQSDLTNLVRKTHEPLITWLFNLNEK